MAAMNWSSLFKLRILREGGRDVEDAAASLLGDGVRGDVASINAAKSALAQLDARIDKTAKKLSGVRIETDTLENKVNAASTSMMQRLRSQVKFTKHGLQAGILKFGSRGVGFAGQVAFNPVAVLGRAGGAVLNKSADIRDTYKTMKASGASDRDIAAMVLGDSAAALLESLGNMFGLNQIGKGIGRWNGLDEDDAQKVVDMSWKKFINGLKTWGGSRMDVLDRERKQAAEEVRANLHEPLMKNFEKVWNNIAHYTPQTFRLAGIKDEMLYRKLMEQEGKATAFLKEYEQPMKKALDAADQRVLGGG